MFAEHESVKNSSLLHCLLALLSIQEYEGVWVKISASFNLFCQIWFPLLSTRNLSSWIQLQYVVGKWTETLKLFTSFKIILGKSTDFVYFIEKIVNSFENDMLIGQRKKSRKSLHYLTEN